MNLVLLLPAALAALAALLLPLLIHLARRSELRPTPFAALRWLRREAKPRRRVRFDEWLLLALRLLLLALLALWLARPALHGGQADAPWVAVVPGIDAGDAGDLAADPRAQLRWLAPGFPALDRPPPAAPVAVASLLRQLDAELAPGVALTVVAPERLEGMDARRPALSRPVDWQVLPGAMPARDSDDPAPPPLHVRHPPAAPDALRFLRAAALAWHDADALSSEAFSAGPAAQPLDPQARHLVWLVPGELPAPVRAWVEAGGVALLDASVEAALPDTATAWWHDAHGAPLVEGGRSGQGRLLRFTRELSPRQMPQLLEADFPRQLRELLDGPAPAPASALAVDHAPDTGAAGHPQPPRELRPWLALLIALLFLVERWLATSRRRGAGP